MYPRLTESSTIRANAVDTAAPWMPIRGNPARPNISRQFPAVLHSSETTDAIMGTLVSPTLRSAVAQVQFRAYSKKHMLKIRIYPVPSQITASSMEYRRMTRSGTVIEIAIKTSASAVVPTSRIPI